MTTGAQLGRPIEILLVEDNPADIRLTEESFKSSGVPSRIHVVDDGDRALQFLRQEDPYQTAPRPDMVLLDLNLPGKHGLEVLAEIKSDDRLETIPVVILTTSDNDQDIDQAYKLKANCYLSKPVDFNQFIKIVGELESFWFSMVHLPKT